MATDTANSTTTTEPEVVSRHVTSEGVLVYLRTTDGELQARLHRWNGGSWTVVNSGRRAHQLRAC